MIGVWTFIAMAAITFGITKGYVDNAIRYQTSHLQIHHPSYGDSKKVEFTISDIHLETIKAKPEVEFATQRTLVQGMIKSSRGARGITVKGIDPVEEEQLISIKEKIEEGTFFEEEKRNQIVISRDIADKLKVKLRKKVVLQFLDKEGEIIAGSFRIAGIYDTGNRFLDFMSVYVRQEDISRLLKTNDTVHEVVIKLKNPKRDLENIEADLANTYPNLLVENYRKVAPDVELYETQIYISITILLVIFMLALVFGIINTMLMAVLERTKEIGMLMAVGMNKLQIFGMIVLETLLLGLIGAPLGLLAGWTTVQILRKTTIDLSGFAEGAEKFGMQTSLRPFLENGVYIQLMVAVFITALVASIYPALRAIRLKPMEAIRKI